MSFQGDTLLSVEVLMMSWSPSLSMSWISTEVPKAELRRSPRRAMVSSVKKPAPSFMRSTSKEVPNSL